MDDLRDIFLYFKSNKKIYLLPITFILLIVKFSLKRKILFFIILSTIFLLTFISKKQYKNTDESISLAIGQYKTENEFSTNTPIIYS